MHKGKIMAIGKPDDVKNLVSSTQNIIVSLEKATPELLSSIRNLDNVVSLTQSQESPDATILRIEVSDARISPLVASVIIQSGGLLHSMKIEEPTLEETLIKLTGGK